MAAKETFDITVIVKEIYWHNDSDKYNEGESDIDSDSDSDNDNDSDNYINTDDDSDSNGNNNRERSNSDRKDIYPGLTKMQWQQSVTVVARVKSDSDDDSNMAVAPKMIVDVDSDNGSNNSKYHTKNSDRSNYKANMNTDICMCCFSSRKQQTFWKKYTSDPSTVQIARLITRQLENTYWGNRNCGNLI